MVEPASEFTDKVALITGGTEGIGLATARRFMREGARVVIAARDAGRGARVLAELHAAGGTAAFMGCGIGQPDAAERLVAFTLAEFGRLDMAVNNAAADIGIAPTAEVTEAEFDTRVAVNLKGLWLCMKHEIVAMQRSGGGDGGAAAIIARLVGTRTAGAAGAPRRDHSARAAGAARRDRGGDCLAVLGRVFVGGRPCTGDRRWIDRMNPGA